MATMISIAIVSNGIRLIIITAYVQSAFYLLIVFFGGKDAAVIDSIEASDS